MLRRLRSLRGIGKDDADRGKRFADGARLIPARFFKADFAMIKPPPKPAVIIAKVVAIPTKKAPVLVVM